MVIYPTVVSLEESGGLMETVTATPGAMQPACLKLKNLGDVPSPEKCISHCKITWKHFVGDTVGVWALNGLHENRPRLCDVRREEGVISARKREHVSRLWSWIVSPDKTTSLGLLHQSNFRGLDTAKCCVTWFPLSPPLTASAYVLIVCVLFISCMCTCVSCYCLYPKLQGHIWAGAAQLTETDLSHCNFFVFHSLSHPPSLLLYVNSCHGNYFALPLFAPGVCGW